MHQLIVKYTYFLFFYTLIYLLKHWTVEFLNAQIVWEFNLIIRIKLICIWTTLLYGTLYLIIFFLIVVHFALISWTYYRECIGLLFAFFQVILRGRCNVFFFVWAKAQIKLLILDVITLVLDGNAGLFATLNFLWRVLIFLIWLLQRWFHLLSFNLIFWIIIFICCHFRFERETGLCSFYFSFLTHQNCLFFGRVFNHYHCVLCRLEFILHFRG